MTSGETIGPEQAGTYWYTVDGVWTKNVHTEAVQSANPRIEIHPFLAVSPDQDGTR